MRFLSLALLLLAAPLLAQEPSEEERRAAEERAAKDAERAAERAAQEAAAAEARKYAERAEDLRRVQQQRSKWGATEEEIRRALADLRSQSEAKREEATELLNRVTASLDEILPIFRQVLADTERLRGAVDVYTNARTLYVGAIGSEEITGSADGTDYTLKSLGEGKYDLHATKRNDEGKLMEEWKDKGTLKELQGKHAFLKAGLAIQVPDPVARFSVQARAVPEPAALAGVPPTVRLEAARNWGVLQHWSGGGQVGVSVVAPTEDLRFHLELPEGAGFIVQQVVPGSRAEEIGIRRMDVLLRLDGELIDTPIQLKKLHERKGVLEIIRRSEARKIDLATVPETKPADAPAAAKEEAPAGAR